MSLGFIGWNAGNDIGMSGMGISNPGGMWTHVGMNALAGGLASLDSVDDIIVPPPDDTPVDVSGIIALAAQPIEVNLPPGGVEPIGAAPAINTATGQTMTSAQIAQAISSAASSAVSLYRSASGGPYILPGTNIVYNPATGQMVGTAAAAGSPASLSFLTSGYMPYILVGGLLLMVFAGRGR